MIEGNERSLVLIKTKNSICRNAIVVWNHAVFILMFCVCVMSPQHELFLSLRLSVHFSSAILSEEMLTLSPSTKVTPAFLPPDSPPV